MNSKISTLGAVAAFVAFAAVPATSEAKSGPEAALDACVKSFVATYLPERTIRDVQKQGATPSPVSRFWAPRDYTILLEARGVRSGDLIAEARCVASRQGFVVVIEPQILAGDKARADFVVSMR